MLIYICECIVSLYIEMLLTNTSITMNLNTISRLSEDVELLTKLFDELRNKIYLSRMQLGARAPHIIATPVAEAPNKRRMLNFGVNPKLGKNKTAASKAGAAPATAKPSAAVVNSVPSNANQTEEERLSTTLLAMEEETKTTFRVILQPLSHLVLAVQMNNQYLPDFVRAELYTDFGVGSLNIWQLIMYWRKESKEDIIAAYDKLYSTWDPEEIVEDPLVDISGYMGKVKPANLIK